MNNSRYASRLTTILVSLVFGSLLVSSFLASPAQAQEQPDLRVIEAEKHDISPPLREVDVSSLPPMRKEDEGNKEIYNQPPPGTFTEKPKGFTDPSLQTNQYNRNAPAPIKNFDGLGVADDDEVIGGRVAPPDPVHEAGEDYILEMVNLVLAVYDKDGNQVFGPVPNNAIWSDFGGTCETENAGDPIVNYDQSEDRWVISQFANPGASDASQCVAVSQTSDPTGSWYRYEFETTGNDYPKMGVGTEAYYLSWRDFATASGDMRAAALEKDAMLQGDDAIKIEFGPTSGIGTRPPADIDGELPPADTPHPFPALEQDAVSIYGFDPDFETPDNSTFEELANLGVDGFTSSVCDDGGLRDQCVPQPNGPDLETLSGVLMHRANVRDFGDYMSMVATHTVRVPDERAGMRWYEFRNDGSGWSLHQQGTFAPDDGLHRWMGSIAINPSGAIALGYSVSSESQTPSIRYTGRPEDAPLGEMTFQEEEIFEGPTSQGGTNRWGDYSAMVTDAANPNTFWFVGEYASDDFATFNWDTRIAAFQFDVDDETPPEAIADLSASTASATEVDLSWTAPSDPPDDVAASGYDIRYSTDPIEDDQDFENAQQFDDAPTPSEPGETDETTVDGLSPDTEYYFAIKSSDIVGNTSGLSNVPSATTEPAPVVGTDPDSLSETLTVGETGSDILSILNEGAGTLSFELEPVIGGSEISDPLAAPSELRDLTGKLPSRFEEMEESQPVARFGSGEHSALADPGAGQSGQPLEGDEPLSPMLDPVGTMGYGNDVFNSEFELYSFDLGVPSETDLVDDGVDSFAASFVRGSSSTVYWIDNGDNNLKTYNIEDGSVETIGELNPENPSGETWADMEVDYTTGTTYVTTTEGSGAPDRLYELDTDNAELTLIGEYEQDGVVLGLAIDDSGNAYVHEIIDDEILSLDLETLETEVLGPTGIDANFAQSMTYDHGTDQVLMAAYKGSSASVPAELRQVDTETGETELIGPIGPEGEANELAWFTTPGPQFQWLTAEPTEGDVEAGASKDINLTYETVSDDEDVSDLVGGLDYLATVQIESNDPSTETTEVPVTLTVEGNPAIGFSDDPLAFGEVFSGTSQTETLSVINESDDAILQVADLQIDGEAFTLLDNSSFVLDPGESRGVQITFSPDDSDTFEGTLSLTSSAGDQEVSLTGQGVPFVSIAPDSLDQTIDLTTGDSTATDEFTVTNEFDESLPVDVVVEALEGSNNSVDLTPKLADEELRRWRQLQERTPQASDVEPSLEPAPNQGEGGPSAIERFFENTQLNDPVGVTAYGNELLAPEIVSFDIGEPGAFTVVDEGVDSYAGNFAFANNDQVYWIDNADNTLKTYVLDDGSVEVIGELDPVAGSDVTWTDLETDPTEGTTYVTTGDDAASTNRLYELDVDDAELSLVGEFADGDLVVAFGIDDQGIGYAHDISNDQILTVDLGTAETEVLGSTGIDANFAQSMTWDGETGQLLMAALHDCSLFGCSAGTLRQVDRETGNTTAIGAFPDGGSDEFGWLATPGTGIPWLATNLESGVLPAGASLTLEAQYDASQQVEGEYGAQISIVGSNLEGEPSEELPVSLTVEAAPVLFVSKDALGYESTFVNDTTSTQMVTVRNDGLANMNITDVSIDSDNFAVWPNPDSTVTIEPGDAKIFEVAFTPQEVGDLSATLSFEGDEVSGEVSLSGEGIPAPELAVEPASFERQAYVGQEQELPLTVTNVGEDTLEYDAMSTTGDLLSEDFTGDEFPPEGWFRAGANDGMNWTTPENSACSIWIPSNSACFYWSPSTEGTQRMVTKQLDTPDAELVLEFTHIIDVFASDPEFELRLETTGDGGETWTTVATFPAEDLPETEETIVLDNEDVGSDEFHIAWTYDGDSFDINSWGITEMQLGTPDWLAVSPNEGALTSGESLEHTVSVDASGLAEGTFEASIVANTNDPLAPTASVPFTLNVIEDLAVTPFPTMDEVNPNEEFGVDFNVESLDDLEVFSYELEMAFNPDRVNVQEVVTEGTLSEDLTLTSDIDNEEGTLSIAAADSDGSSPGEGSPLFEIEGEGTLVSIDAQGQSDLGDVTLDITNMVFNEGEPPSTAKDSTISIVPLYGDVDLNLSLTAADASTVLDFVVGKTQLGGTQTTHADVSGEEQVSAFDASLILRRTVGDIDCFPVVPGCDASQPAVASKSSEASSETGRFKEIFAWGDVSRTQPSAKNAGSSEGTLALPLKTDKAVWSASYGDIRAIDVTTEIAPDKVSVEGLETQLPDDWRAVYHVSDDGTLKVSMAGATPLNKVGKVATLTLRRKDDDAKLEMGGKVTINEGSGHELETKSIVSIPDEFALEGTFPNPFRQSATMKIDLPEKANVTVEVYDLLGRKVKTAHDGEMSAGADRTVRIDGADLSSGTYFYRARVEMEDNTRIESGKMTVVQ